MIVRLVIQMIIVMTITLVTAAVIKWVIMWIVLVEALELLIMEVTKMIIVENKILIQILASVISVA